ncbi:MAG: ABC transporter permease [Anaerolineae bacterium]|nr:ABC transporter permease [Anaerolineae bacterium]
MTTLPHSNQRSDDRSNQEFQRMLYQFRQSPLSVVGLIMVSFIVIVALLGPALVPFPQDATGTTRMKDRMLGPNDVYLMGTDDVGRDVFSRTVIATQTSLVIGVVVLVIAILIGLPLGAISGYFGGWIDEIIMRVTDVFLTVPALLLAMAMAAALGAGMTNAMLAIALVWWPGYTRLVRGQVLALREQDFIEAGRALGANRWHILWKHVIPNVLSAVIIKASLDMGFAILVTAGLGYIGVGVQAPTPEWGVMISEGRGFLREAWWISVFPGIGMFITVLGFNLLGDGLRDIFDPKQRR